MIRALAPPTVRGGAGLYRLGLELTLHLADGRAFDFRIVHEDRTIHSTARGLYIPD